ncbi:hypothetical protein ABZ801_15575 [Actinomadura sp. NPDC047616]|uniref:hypothetical protein n=1 Tax=Actinomadura sp. NPDC047616 TaxID=3155914 RepID=UPI0033D893B3
MVVRSAAPLAGTSARPVTPPPSRAVLVACGSHTDGATRRLDRLPVPARPLPPAETLLDPGHDPTAELDRLAEPLRHDRGPGDTVHQVVVPGNVGDDSVLLDIVGMLRPSERTEATP